MKVNVYTVLFLQMFSRLKATENNGSSDVKTNISPEMELLEKMIYPSQQYGRPVMNYSKPVIAFVGLEITQITVRWLNELVSWNSSEYDNLKSINVSPNLVWTPELCVYNSMKQTGTWITTLMRTKVSISSSGMSNWLSPIDFTTTCQFIIKRFPFDTQHCEITLGPWTEDLSKVYLNRNGLPTLTTAYVPNVEWKIVETKQVVVDLKYECCPIPFRVLRIYVTIQRKPLFYSINCIAPCMFLLIVLLVGHLLPPESGERITISIMISLAFILMMEFTSSILPLTGEISALAEIYMILTIVISLSILVTCYILNLYHRVFSFIWIPRFLEMCCIPRALWKENINDGINDDVKSIHLNEIQSDKAYNRILENSDAEDNQSPPQSLLKRQTASNDGDPANQGSTIEETANSILQKILWQIRHYNRETFAPCKEDDYQKRARYIAGIMDKIFIVLILVILITAVLVDFFI